MYDFFVMKTENFQTLNSHFLTSKHTPTLNSMQFFAPYFKAYMCVHSNDDVRFETMDTILTFGLEWENWCEEDETGNIYYQFTDGKKLYLECCERRQYSDTCCGVGLCLSPHFRIMLHTGTFCQFDDSICMTYYLHKKFAVIPEIGKVEFFAEKKDILCPRDVRKAFIERLNGSLLSLK